MERQNILIYALDADFNITGVIDEFSAFQYTRSWAGIGDWTLNLNASQKTDIDALKAAAYIKIDSIGSGVISKITEDIQSSGKSYKIQGVELKGLAQKRIVLNTEAITDKPCNIIEALLTDNLLNPENVNRQIAGSIVNIDVGESIDYTAKYEVLADAIKQLAETYNLGWKAEIENNTIIWYISGGVDRTKEQQGNEVLLIGYDVNTLDASTIEESKANTNTAIVAGAGEGEQRTIEIVNDDNAGIERTELFVDARGDEDLQAKGNEALSAYGTDNIIDTKPSNLLISRFVKGEFDLGDTGTLIDHNNTNARLTEITYIFENVSVDIRFTFGYGLATIGDALKAATANYKQLLKQEGGGGSGGAVSSVNGKTGAVVLDYSDVGALPNTTVIPTRTSQLTNDSDFVTTASYNPTAKTAAMTQAVGVDTNGKLWTAQGGGSIGEWVQFTPNGTGISVATTCYKKLVNGVVYLRGACRYTNALAQSSTADFHGDIGVDYSPSEAVVLPLAGDYANFLLYVNPNGTMQIRNRTDASRTNMWFRIDCSYAI